MLTCGKQNGKVRSSKQNGNKAKWQSGKEENSIKCLSKEVSRKLPETFDRRTFRQSCGNIQMCLKDEEQN